MSIFFEIVSGIFLPFFLVAFGVIFSIKFKFFYFIHPIKLVKDICKNKNGGFRALSVALAGTLGIGNIVGVASAIIMGGAGSIFWMWVSALCAMSLKYAEVVLAMRFRRQESGNFHGGAFYYINDGFTNKIGKKPAYFLSCIFAILCVINSLTTGNLVQINSVSSLLPINSLIFGIMFAALAFVIIIGGYKRISKITSYLIPCLTVIYVVACLFIIFSSLEECKTALITIFKSAFSLKSVSGGVTGYTVSMAIRYGVARGVISNEAGCGTSPCAHASSKSTDAHSQGCLGIFEVFVDTILLCTLTAMVILISQSKENNPTMLVLSSFKYFLGDGGKLLITIISILFAFATVLCQFFYGAEALRYISKSKKVKTMFLFIFSLVTVIGAVIPMALMWQISDFAISMLTIMNVICLFVLRNQI